jgi:hypothetical protein
MGYRVKAAAEHNLDVVGGGKISYAGTTLAEDLDYVLYGTLEGAEAASLASLRQALMRWRRRRPRNPNYPPELIDPDEGRVWLGLSPASDGEFHQMLRDSDLPSRSVEYIHVPPTSPALFLDGDRFRVRIEISHEKKPDPATARKVLGPFLWRRGASCEVTVTEVPYYEGRGYTLVVDLDSKYPRGATVRDAWRLGDEAQALLRASEDGELSQSVALDLLLAGRWDLFRGWPETGWLEAKGEPYDHLIRSMGKNWRFELAKDVAAFANSPDGGLIVLGMTTENEGDGDVIRRPKEFELNRVSASTYRRHISQIVYPRVIGFEVRRIAGRDEDHGLVVLVIPPQAESSRPFLVQGTVLYERKVIGSHVLWPVRREDDTASMDAGAIHTRLRLGEQVIRGGGQAA